jgi:hypothetical protein
VFNYSYTKEVSSQAQQFYVTQQFVKCFGSSVQALLQEFKHVIIFFSTFFFHL